MADNARGPAGDGASDDNSGRAPDGTPSGDPPPPGFIDLGDGELFGLGPATADDCLAAAEWLERNYPEHSQDPPRGSIGPIYNMSNYRVRQVLGLGLMPERQLRFLIALATWMGDDSPTVRVGLATLIEESGNTHNTVTKARRELESAGMLKSQGGRGKGNLTVWTALCLPETAGKGTSDVGPFTADSKGTSDVGPFTPAGEAPKGTNREPQKVPTEGSKRYQGQAADQQEQNMGFNPRANTSGSLSLSAREADDAAGDGKPREERDAGVIEGKITSAPRGAPTLAERIDAAVGCTVENAEAFIQHMRRKPKVRSATALLNTAINNGTIADLYAEEAASAAEMAQLLSDLRSTPPPAPPPAPESREHVRVMEEPQEPGWKQVECPVCKAAPGAFCVNPATGAAWSGHRERLQAARRRQAEAAS